jgi:hypothetical protein
MTNWNFNALLDISTNPNEIFENSHCIVNLNTEQITWKAGMYMPKMAKNIRYHLKVRNAKK